MTEPARAAPRKTFVILLAVFMLIAGYWTVRVLSHRSSPKQPRTTTELIDELKTFGVPENTQRVGTIAPLQDDPAQDVVAHYKSESDCQTLASYYKNEFNRRGFQPRQRVDEDPKPESESMSFYGHDTWGHYGCKPEVRGSHYLLSLRPLSRAE